MEGKRTENQYLANMHQVGAELSSEKLHQVGGDFPLPFALVPWRHHVEIITKCKSIDEALFYVGKTTLIGSRTLSVVVKMSLSVVLIFFCYLKNFFVPLFPYKQ